MANVTQGLFGFSPEAPAQSQMERLQAESQRYARLSPVQAAHAQMYQAGHQLGNVASGMMGGQDSDLQAQALMRDTASKLDLNDHVAVRNVANQWLKSGNVTLQNKALQLNDVADKAEESFNSRAKEKAANDKAARLAKNQLDFSREYAEAPDAETRLAVTRKYADMPDLIKIDEAAAARKDKYEEARTARTEKIAEAQRAQEAELSNRRFIAGENNKQRASSSNDARIAAASTAQSTREAAQSVKATLAQEKINNANEKQDDLDAKASAAAVTSTAHSTQMVKNAKEAKALVRFETTGRTGQAAAALNTASDAATLRNRIATVKANLGFDRLQKMRDESPTGGALGQVAVQELEALQASVASLSPLQEHEELSRNFDKVIKHYEGWQDSVTAAEKARVVRRAGPQSINIPGATPRNNRPAPAAATGWGKAVEK